MISDDDADVVRLVLLYEQRCTDKLAVKLEKLPVGDLSRRFPMGHKRLDLLTQIGVKNLIEGGDFGGWANRQVRRADKPGGAGLLH